MLADRAVSLFKCEKNIYINDMETISVSLTSHLHPYSWKNTSTDVQSHRSPISGDKRWLVLLVDVAGRGNLKNKAREYISGGRGRFIDSSSS